LSRRKAPPRFKTFKPLRKSSGDTIMEGMAIAILVMVLLVGAVVFFIFFQFLSTVRENQGLFKQIMEEIKSLQKKVDGISRSPKQEEKTKQTD
jgi:hypothetical protein